MSRILRRPMFRGGRVSSYGTGIASGLADGGMPNKRGLVDGPGGYSGEIEEYKDIVESVRTAYPKKQGLSRGDYLRIASAGLDILGAPGETGGILGGTLSAASKPLSKLGVDLATGMEARDASSEESVKDISAAIMKGRSSRDRGFALGDRLEKLRVATGRRQVLREILDDDLAFVEYLKENHADVANSGDVNKIEEIKKGLQNQLESVENDLKVLLPKDDITVAFLKTPAAGQYFRGIIADEEQRQGKQQGDPDFNWNAVLETIRTGKKDGGIIGYATGGEVEVEEQTEDLNIRDLMKDQGVEYGEQVSVEEEMPEQESGSLSYEELRARLPKEIQDDVVKIIASSDEALIEFSNIATQQDVDAFNSKYGVELVLPQA